MRELRENEILICDGVRNCCFFFFSACGFAERPFRAAAFATRVRMSVHRCLGVRVCV